MIGPRRAACRQGVMMIRSWWRPIEVKCDQSEKGGWMRAFILVLALLLLPGALRAESLVFSLADGRAGTILFTSSTPTGPDQYLENPQEAPAAVISGVLRFPDGSDRVPAIVLTHSSGGVSQDRDLAWADRFNLSGMATFVVDSLRHAASPASPTCRHRSPASRMSMPRCASSPPIPGSTPDASP
jgi:hypothetical protein